MGEKMTFFFFCSLAGRQIKMFLLQLLQQRIKFTPYGLFDVDLGLFSMVSQSKIM
jgi:7tm Chemosensory receptor